MLLQLIPSPFPEKRSSCSCYTCGHVFVSPSSTSLGLLLSLPPEELGLTVKSGTHVTGRGVCWDKGRNVQGMLRYFSKICCISKRILLLDLSVCSYQWLVFVFVLRAQLKYYTANHLNVFLVRPDRTKMYFQSRF